MVFDRRTLLLWGMKTAEVLLGIVTLSIGSTLGIIREGTILFACVNGCPINLFAPRIKAVYAQMESAAERAVSRTYPESCCAAK